MSDQVILHSDLRKHLFSEDGKLRSFVNVYLNDEGIRCLDTEASPVKETDTINIAPSIVGGRQAITCSTSKH